jgi:hypothetical protein
MKLTRCPVCHYHIELETLIQDQAGKELLALLAQLNTLTASSVLAYIGLFRPFKSDLNTGRALRLVNDVLALTPNQTALCQALDQTVSQIMQSRRDSQNNKQLGNHNYLKKVLTSIAGWDLNTPGVNSHALTTRSAQDSKTTISSAILDVHNIDWANGLDDG